MSVQKSKNLRQTNKSLANLLDEIFISMIYNME